MQTHPTRYPTDLSDEDAEGMLMLSFGVPVVRLTEVFRQTAHSRIITNAHRINEAQLPQLAAKDAASDFYFVEREEPEWRRKGGHDRSAGGWLQRPQLAQRLQVAKEAFQQQ